MPICFYLLGFASRSKLFFSINANTTGEIPIIVKTIKAEKQLVNKEKVADYQLSVRTVFTATIPIFRLLWSK